jgi:hypothetical protein
MSSPQGALERISRPGAAAELRLDVDVANPVRHIASRQIRTFTPRAGRLSTRKGRNRLRQKTAKISSGRETFHARDCCAAGAMSRGAPVGAPDRLARLS